MKYNIIQKYSKQITMLSLTLIFSLSACDKELLSPVPETAISDANAFDTLSLIHI